MLKVHNLSKSYGIQTLLHQVSFNLNPGERLGLIGPNGCGKSTLLKILAGVEKADSGWVALDPSTLQIGYLPQGLTDNSRHTIERFIDDRIGQPAQLSDRLEILANRLAAHPDQVQLQQEYDKTLTKIQATAHFETERNAVLASLGLDQVELTAPVAQLSGGQKTRLALASVLLFSPELFLLDEPTNHLDIEMLEWLENWLIDSTRKAGRAALIVSHDRVFLDRTVTGILELDPTTHQLKAYTGNYSAYVEQKLTELENHWKSYDDQQEEITRLKQTARTIRSKAAFKKGGKGDSGDKFARGFFSNRTKEHVARAKHIERRLEAILTDEKIDKPRRSWQMKLDFDRTLESSRQVLVTESLDIGYGEIPLLTDLNLALRFGQRLALIGPNGSGKTTLLRTIAGILPPMAGRVQLGGTVRLGYMAQEQEALNPEQNALEIIRLQSPFSETDARTFLHQFLFSGDDVFTPVRNLSFGERSRLMLAGLVASGCNLLLLDEPINHLDIPSRARFESALSVFNGTLIVVAHDRYFIDQIANTLWEIRPNGLKVIPKG